uniref:Ankyrin repeat protein n=1 Tax=viral metagenome TaxID=1070528 RepID=A0A6C0JW22_9ZZZZ
MSQHTTKSTKKESKRIIDLALTFKSSGLPPYVVADIIDWDRNRKTDLPASSAFDVNDIVQTIGPIMQPESFLTPNECQLKASVPLKSKKDRFLKALKDGDEKEVHRQLECNYTDYNIDDYTNFIYVALGNDHDEIAKIIFEKMPTTYDRYYLMFEDVIDERFNKFLEYLLTNPKINRRRIFRGEDILEFAIKSGNSEAVRLLLQSPDIRAPTEADLRDVIQSREPEILQIFLNDTRVVLYPQVFISIISEYDYAGPTKRKQLEEKLQMLLEDGRIDPTFHNNEAIREAYKRKEWDIVNMLLADPRVQATGYIPTDKSGKTGAGFNLYKSAGSDERPE